MKPHSMPAELVELEKRLGGRTEEMPAAGLRERVMQAVAVELAMPRQSSSAGQWNGWHWLAVAAIVLMFLNLSLITASQDEFSVRPAPDPHQAAVEFQALRQLEAQQEGLLK